MPQCDDITNLMCQLRNIPEIESGGEDPPLLLRVEEALPARVEPFLGCRLKLIFKTLDFVQYSYRKTFFFVSDKSAVSVQVGSIRFLL